MESEELKKFLTDLVREKAQVELEQEVEDQLVADLYQRLENQIYREMVDQLTDEKLDDINNKDLSPEEIIQLIQSQGVNIQDVVTKVLTNFRMSYLGT